MQFGRTWQTSAPTLPLREVQENASVALYARMRNNWFSAKTYNTDLVIDGMRIQFAPCAEELARKSMDAAGLFDGKGLVDAK